MVVRSRILARTGLAALAMTLGAALVGPAPVSAEPSLPDLSALSGLESLSLSSIPGDAELAEALRTLKSTGGDAKLVEVLQTILDAEGSPDLSTLGVGGTTPEATPNDPATSGTTDPADQTDPTVPVEPNSASATPVDDPLTTAATGLEAFEKLTGAEVLTPAFAPFCAPTSENNPLGLATAPAIAVPGPFPNVGGQTAGDALADALKALGVPFINDLLKDNTNLDKLTQGLKNDQTAFALVPPATHTNPNFQVAWFNTATMTGNIAELDSAGKVVKGTALEPLLSGTPIRLARVDTGQGSILTAVFGTTTNAGRTCYFLPAVGIVDTPAK